MSRKQVEVGQLVQAGQPVMSIVADTGIWVTANFKETQLDDIKVGQPVEFDVDAYGGCTAEGKVESLSARDGREVRATAAGQRDGQLHEGRSARAGANRGDEAVWRGSSVLDPGMSVDVHVTQPIAS